MRYLDKDDLIEVIQEKFLEDSIQFDDKTIDGLEKKAIAFVVSYISGRYKTDEIFGGDWWEEGSTAPGPNGSMKRHPLIIFVMARLVVFWAVRRNAARKVPEDYKEIKDEAISILTKIQSGVQTLPGMPEVTGDDGFSAKLIYGNTTNDNLFI